MEILKGGIHEEFVTVVNVQGTTKPELETFVTVLSIGNQDEGTNLADGHPEEEVDVFRLPGERLGFGLKFEGGNKTSEKVRKLFVQSCASESPASRAVCSWGTLGEGDEVLSIDGVPVTDMSRLDCVRRLKESQLVIKLLVRYRGVLRPEVVSAERKSSPEKRNKVPPELPSAPPPVPPRKLRQPRGPADGDANPSPVRKPWDNPNKSGSSSSSSAAESPARTQNTLAKDSTCSKSTSYESCTSSPGSKNNSKNSSPKSTVVGNNGKTQSPDLNKTRQDPPEAAVYLDARCHDGCSTHGSTSDDTSSSMSTVIDRFSSSDRFSTVSTISTTSTASGQPQGTRETQVETNTSEHIDLVRLLAPFDQLEREFGSSTPTTDYLLTRLANSEAVTFVEALGDGDHGLVERVTAVVAPNTVLIEETITLQPPLSFQDAPLSYGHETRPGLVYTDLAADSTTHFRPIKDDALIVDCVNGNLETAVPEFTEGPPLPARNHVNRVTVNQDVKKLLRETSDEIGDEAPVLPPKPMPRKDVKSKRKRPPPPPPPPPPRREIPAIPDSGEQDNSAELLAKKGAETEMESNSGGNTEVRERNKVEMNNERNKELQSVQINGDENAQGTNKMLEIIEMRKAKAVLEKSIGKIDDVGELEEFPFNNNVAVPDAEVQVFSTEGVKNSANQGDMIDETPVDTTSDDSVDDQKQKDNDTTYRSLDEVARDIDASGGTNSRETPEDEDSTDESDGDSYYWQSNLATIGEEEETNSLEFTSSNRNLDSEEDSVRDGEQGLENDATRGKTDENDDEEDGGAGDEDGDGDGDGVDCLRGERTRESEHEEENQSAGKSPVNGRMENCGGGQRLPPDGDEFPATYQEFGSTQQQYQFVAGARVSTTPASNCEPRVEKKKNSSNDFNNSNSQEKTILLQDSRVLSLRSSLKEEATLPMDGFASYRENNTTVTNEISEKKINLPSYRNDDQLVPESGPPPLPTSRPPRIDNGKLPPQPTQRKFSLNGDLRRQDDKSEKSVRDKIAMFSSQSSLEVPLFPATASSGLRRLSKYKSSEDVFAEESRVNIPVKEKNDSFRVERTRSSFDLSDTYDATTPPSLPTTSPPGSPRTNSKNTLSIEFKSVPGILISAKNTSVSTNANATTTTPNTSTTTSLGRAISFSGGSSTLCSRSQSLGDLPPTSQVTRTNSLASTFRRPNDDMRRTSLNQLIEQRRKGISKLRGLVIPEKEVLPISQPIVDLPEIKSRDSILLQQIPCRATIHDRWGSQSSISSSISTTSVPGKITTSFKMPEPQNLPKYSPAFKRKSLAIYGNSTAGKNPSSTSAPVSEAPKSLESICSPTRSDVSFEYVPTSGSARSRATLRKARTEYDDSDNDSAVSSSQSSISRGFSPPVSPVPSERSTLSSERSYLSAETTNSGNFHLGESRVVASERSQFTTRPTYLGSERSSSSSSSPDPRSPIQSDSYSRNALKRSSSTDTNCSTSSTLTSGSQASAESLSRRVLKPQSVEAINRKNILASARCRSGRDLNGSPLIQRKFPNDEKAPVSKLARQNGKPAQSDVKIAYIDVDEPFPTNDDSRNLPQRPEVIQTSSDVKAWVHAEIKTLGNSPAELTPVLQQKVQIEVQVPKAEASHKEPQTVESVPRSKANNLVTEKDDSQTNNLLAVLSTKSRSRSTIHIEERSMGRSKSQMSLEEILDSRGGGQEDMAKSWLKEKSFTSKIPTPDRPKVPEKNDTELVPGPNSLKSNSSRIPTPRNLLQGRRSASVTDMKKALEKSEQSPSDGIIHSNSSANTNSHARFPSLDSSNVASGDIDTERYLASEQFGSISSLASSTSLISQQELAQLVEEATLEEVRGVHDVIVVLYHKENPAGSVGIALAGGIDCETKEITVHRVLAHSIADKDGRVQRGDRILSINGRSTKGLSHRESLAVLKQPRSEVVLVVSRARDDYGGRLRSRTESVETIVEGSETNGVADKQTAWGPPASVAIHKDGAGLGFSLEGGRDSPLGNRPLIVKKIFAGGAAEKTGALRAGDQMLQVNGNDVTRMSRIEAWSLMKKLCDGEVSLLVRHPATKSTS